MKHKKKISEKKPPAERPILKVGILVASDSRSAGKNEELCIPAISAFLLKNGYSIVKQAVCPDEISPIRKTISEWARNGNVDIILTSGGTGVSPRDVTPEATRGLLEMELPGIPEAMRAASLKKTPNAMVSRALAGLVGKTLVVNLPGSPRGAVENLSAVHSCFAHIVAKAGGDPSECAPQKKRK
jgi:molybdenum cofactor synthesis domain-containing protein